MGDIFDITDEDVVENHLNEKKTKTHGITRLHYTVYDPQLTVSLEAPNRKAGKLPGNSVDPDLSSEGLEHPDISREGDHCSYQSDLGAISRISSGFFFPSSLFLVKGELFPYVDQLNTLEEGFLFLQFWWSEEQPVSASDLVGLYFSNLIHLFEVGKTPKLVLP